MRAKGRLFSPDDRDQQHLIRNLPQPVSVPEPRPYRYWNAEAWWGNQGVVPQCVAYGWTHWLEDGPVTHPGAVPMIEPQWLYDAAQAIDPWAGTPHEGTTVRAAAKVLQQAGLIRTYHWAFRIEDIIDCLLNRGPVVIGTNWYEGMEEPDEQGFIKISGQNLGGHCTKLDGINVDHELVRGKNSWGRDWGHNGFYLLRFKDLEQLIHEEDGEACLAVEAPSA